MVDEEGGCIIMKKNKMDERATRGFKITLGKFFIFIYPFITFEF